jgi:hypothetical protein
MEFDQGPVSKHLANQIQQYRIPEFQRPYSWRRSDWETLLVDILRQYKGVAQNWEVGGDTSSNLGRLTRKPSHYIGAIVTADSVAVAPPRSTVVDGQQRLLTLMVVILAMRDLWMKRLSKPKDADALADVMARYRPWVTNVGSKGLDLWRVLPSETDRSAYRVLVQEDRPQGKIAIAPLGFNASESTLLIEAFNYFRQEFSRNHLLGSAPFYFDPFVDLYPLEPEILEHVVLNRLVAVKLVASFDDDPNMIFESLNTKGRPLQQVDLIKNFLYLSLGEDASEVHATYWRPIEMKMDPKDLEKFAWAWQVSIGDNILQKRTYDAVQRRLRGQPDEMVKDYVKSLHRESSWFLSLVNPTFEVRNSICAAIANVLEAGGSTALPLMLYCYRELQHLRASEAEFVESMWFIESFLVRRALAGKGTQILNPMFGAMCDRLNGDDDELLAMPLPFRIRFVLSVRQDEWPSDSQVERGINEEDFYHKSDSTLKFYILRKLDGFFNEKRVALAYEADLKTVEHIAPQNLKSVWWHENLSHDEYQGLFSRIHCLANLTLLTPGENSSLGDAGWPKKHAAYSSCDYPMSNRIASMFDIEGGWTVERMEARARDLTSAVAKIWHRELLLSSKVDSLGTLETSVASDEDDTDYFELLDLDSPAE